MKRSTTETCCLTLPLVTEKWQSDRLEKRFEIARQIYNTLLNYELKKFRLFEHDEEYKIMLNHIRKLYNEGKRDKDKDYKRLKKRLLAYCAKRGISENQFKSKKDIGKLYKHFEDNIKSKVAYHGIADQVWKAFDAYLSGRGKEFHFKKRGEIQSLQGSTNGSKSGGAEIVFRGTYIEWKGLKEKRGLKEKKGLKKSKGLKFPIKLDANNSYETEMLQKHVKYCRIVRKICKNKTRWYVQLLLLGKPALKCDTKTGELRHPTGTGAVGIDIGPQSIAFVSETTVELRELAKGVKNIEREKRIIQRKLDRSRRANNPDNFEANGEVKRGVKLHWVNSNRYRKLCHELAFLQHQQAEIRKREHIDLANRLLVLGDCFYVEKMNWTALTRRAKKTEISEKTGRYKRKKRFGKSVGNKAPAMLLGILEQKLKSRGMGDSYVKVDTNVRASQFNHLTGEYQKKPLSQRWNDMPDGRRIQRDMYSAFLLQHMNQTRDGFDLAALDRDYDSFVVMHDREVERLKKEKKTLSSMGIRRTAS